MVLVYAAAHATALADCRVPYSKTLWTWVLLWSRLGSNQSGVSDTDRDLPGIVPTAELRTQITDKS
jgi:hypothetical protein